MAIFGIINISNEVLILLTRRFTMTGFKTIEKKYGVKVVSEGHHYNGVKSVETFKMYSADGCC